MKKPTALFWSGGKDSTLALYELLQSPEYEVQKLVATVNEQYRRVSMHGVRVELIEQQAAALGISLEVMWVPENLTNEVYEEHLIRMWSALKQEGIEHIAFGDIFLEDLKAYRDGLLTQAGMTGVYPIWKRDTKELLQQFVQLGFKGLTVCVDQKHLNQDFIGKVLNDNFAATLPSTVDPCGENGEFHSFVYDGPMFKQPISITKGEVVEREYKGSAEFKFWFQELKAD